MPGMFKCPSSPVRLTILSLFSPLFLSFTIFPGPFPSVPFFLRTLIALFPVSRFPSEGYCSQAQFFSCSSVVRNPQLSRFPHSVHPPLGELVSLSPRSPRDRASSVSPERCLLSPHFRLSSVPLFVSRSPRLYPPPKRALHTSPNKWLPPPNSFPAWLVSSRRS